MGKKNRHQVNKERWESWLERDREGTARWKSKKRLLKVKHKNMERLLRDEDSV